MQWLKWRARRSPESLEKSALVPGTLFLVKAPQLSPPSQATTGRSGRLNREVPGIPAGTSASRERHLEASCVAPLIYCSCF